MGAILRFLIPPSIASDMEIIVCDSMIPSIHNDISLTGMASK